jgi:hypothetical protein
VEFPARSPDLTITNYFIYPHLKNTVSRSTRHTIEELCEAVRDSRANISPQKLENAFVRYLPSESVSIVTSG